VVGAVALPAPLGAAGAALLDPEESVAAPALAPGVLGVGDALVPVGARIEFALFVAAPDWAVVWGPVNTPVPFAAVPVFWPRPAAGA
jgi:hypothetical protein